MSNDVPFPTNLLPQYQSPQQMAQAAATTANTQANTGQIQAATGLLGAQTQAADIANQGSQLSLGALQKAYANGIPSVTQPTSAPTSIGDTGLDADDVTQHAIDKFAPLPTKPPPALQQQAYLLSLGGRPEAGKLLLDNYATQMGGINQQKLLAASQSYQTAETVASAPPGAAFETLSRVNPQAAAALKQKYADASPEDLDQDVRTFAQHIGIATHQYTGRETDFQNGVLVDKRDGRPVLGSDQVLTGLDAAGKQKAFEDGNSTITLANGLAGRKWQGSIDPSTGQPYTSNEAYVIAADRAARSSAAGGQTNTPATTPGQTSGPPTPSASPKQNAAPASTVATTTDPVLKTALADATYNYKPPTLPRPTTQEELEANKVTASDAAKNYQANANGLKTSSDEVTGASAKALQYFNAAKTILAQPDSKWAAGTPGDVAAMLSKLGINTDAGTTRAEVVKNLTQAALQGLKTTYGSKPAMFDVKVNLEQAFPEIKGDQGLPAVKNLIDENVRNLNYDVATGQRARAYLGAGKDPADFNKWNQQYFDRSATINPGSSQSNPSPTSAATGKTVTRTGTLNGRKVVQYSDGSTAYAQ